MQEILDIDLSTVNVKVGKGNFRIAKILMLVILALMGFAILMAACFKHLESETKGLLIGMPAILAMLISPAGMIFILRSYYKKEVVKLKVLYALGYTLSNGGLLALFYFIIKELIESKLI